MKKKITGIFLELCFTISFINAAWAYADQIICVNFGGTEQNEVNIFIEDYSIQWEMDMVPILHMVQDMRVQQPIGDCDKEMETMKSSLVEKMWLSELMSGLNRSRIT